MEEARDQLKPGDVFYYADEFNVSWLPTLRAMWSPKGQQVMIQTPGQPKVHYGLGAVNYHTGETVVIIRRRKRRPEVAELLQALVDKHPTGTIFGDCFKIGKLHMKRQGDRNPEIKCDQVTKVAKFNPSVR